MFTCPIEVIEITDEDVQQVLDQDYKLPPRHSPNEMYHFNPQNVWDEYENKQYNTNLPHCDIWWQRRIAYIRRLQKLKRKRKTNKNYCNKSELNYSQYQQKHAKLYTFVYNGKLLNHF